MSAKEKPGGERWGTRRGKARAQNPVGGTGKADARLGRSCGAKNGAKPGEDRRVGLKSAFGDPLEVELPLVRDDALPLGDRAPGNAEGASHPCVVPVMLSCLV